MPLHNFLANQRILSAKLNENFQGLADGSLIENGAISQLKIANQFAFSAYAGGATTLTDGAAVTIAFNTEEYDYNGNFASNSYTTPVAGVYHFDACFHINGAVSTPVDMYCAIAVDAVAAKLGARYLTGSSFAAAVSCDILLPQGAVVTVLGFQNSAGNEATLTGAEQTYFSGRLVTAV